jgi:hypothetical protein
VLGMHQISGRHLLVVVYRAAPDWYRALGPRRMNRNGLEYYDIADVTKLNESWIEVLDVETPRVLLRQRPPEVRIYWILGQFVAGYHQDEDGRGKVSLWQVVFTPG